MLRIVAGKLGGRSFQTPPAKLTRPVTGKIRGAIFSTLGGLVQSARVLDLYAGSGALGLEALSRGASEVCFVEKNKSAQRVITSNIRSLGVVNNAIVDTTAVENYLQRENRYYDIIFFDPPYAQFDTTLASKTAALLKPNGIVVISSTVKLDLSEGIQGLALLQKRIYGDTQIAYYRQSIEF